MNENDIQDLKNLLSVPKKICIIPHRSPDGDAMGSTLGLSIMLQKLGHSTTVLAPNDFPNFLAWLPESEKVVIYEKDKSAGKLILNDAEIIFTLDFNAFHRTGEMQEVLSTLTVPFVMIDHHQMPDDYAMFTYSDPKMGSTCEMVYNFFGFLNITHLIDAQIASCLYTGIVTDSGSFKYSSTTSTTHQVAGKLLDLGIDSGTIQSNLFDNNSFESLQLLGKALTNIKILKENNAAYTFLTQADLDFYKYSKGDTEGIVNYCLKIEGIHLAAIFIENADEKITKISFRSLGNFNVNEFARTYFHGGGHINAAGGKSELSVAETLERFERILSDNNIKG